MKSAIADPVRNVLLPAQQRGTRKGVRRPRRIGATSRFAVPKRLEALLRSPWFGVYLEQLIVDVTAPYANIFSRRAIASMRLEMLDELTADPVLRGLVAQIGTALETSHSGAVRVLCPSGAKRAANLAVAAHSVEEAPEIPRLSANRTLKIY